MRKTIIDIRACKGKPEPLVCLTAYTSRLAQIVDGHADLLLVGDSVGMVLYGLDSTLGVDLEMMIRHGQAVVRGTRKACIVVDMPFGSYEESPALAFRNAGRVLRETGCNAVKLEGGLPMADTIAFLVQRGVPVMAHIGLTPQSFNALGGYKARGREGTEAERILDDARAVTDAGAFAVVIEGVMEPLAAAITQSIEVPTVGIGASAACDGQILVSDDMLGLNGGRLPKFVKTYGNLSEHIERAAASYAADVRSRRFPDEAHVYTPKKKGA